MIRKIIKKRNEALQASVRYKKRKNALLSPCISLMHFRENMGSATVEAALILPFFLCAVCTISVIAQFMLAESSIYHAGLQTARVYAKQESCSEKKGVAQNGISLKKMGGWLDKQVIFLSYVDKKCVSSSYVLGGRAGLNLSADSQDDSVKIKVSYILKVPVPYFKYYFLHRSISIKCRKFSGYVLHEGESQDESGDTVYVTEYGKVYHTSLTCPHLMITITDPDKVNKILKSSHYKKCEKCMGSADNPSQVYITKNGDCYHSTLMCSGLKRSVNIMKKADISGIRECSYCANHK